MADRFNDTIIRSGDVILTTKMSDQKSLLVHQLAKSGNYTPDEIACSAYFAKNYQEDDE